MKRVLLSSLIFMLLSGSVEARDIEKLPFLKENPAGKIFKKVKKSKYLRNKKVYKKILNRKKSIKKAIIKSSIHALKKLRKYK
jgi:hypothetical protein